MNSTDKTIFILLLTLLYGVALYQSVGMDYWALYVYLSALWRSGIASVYYFVDRLNGAEGIVSEVMEQ